MSNKKQIVGWTALMLAVTLIASALFFLCYRYDNKYTAKGPQPLAGVLMLDSDTLERHPIVYLIRDWQIYRGKLLTPEDFISNPPTPDELVFIGQYGGFEGHIDGEPKLGPHGSATYRLNIGLPPETKNYTLALPEIFSAYKLYINGTLAAGMGNPDPERYKPQTGNSSVTVQAAGRMEILIAVSDYSHFYSGMVYPPAFGEPSAIAKRLNIHVNLRTLAVAVALCVGLLHLCLWLLTRKESRKNPTGYLPLYYFALCVCFALYTCYPIVKTIFPGGMGWYAVENFAYCVMFLLVMLIQRKLTGISGRWWKPFGAAAVFVCCWALIVPLLLGDSLNLMMAYSWLIGGYAWVSALFLTVSSVWGVCRGLISSKIILAGVAAFDAALVMDRLLPMFEPIRFGWFNELSGGLLVMLVGFVMAMDIAKQYRLRQVIESRAESVSKMLDVQRAYYPVIQEKEEEIRAARHDLRHHISVIRRLVAEGGSEKLKAYLDAFEDKAVKPAQGLYCEHYIANMLFSMYAGLARQQDTDFHVKASLPESLAVDDVALCVILSNLLENALEASQRIPVENRSVSVSVGVQLNMFGIVVANMFSGYLRVQNGRFFSAKQEGREGVGLASVKAVCESYSGSADFYVDKNNVFHSEILIPIMQDETEADQGLDGGL